MRSIRLDTLVIASGGLRRTDVVSAALTSPGCVVSDGGGVCAIGNVGYSARNRARVGRGPVPFLRPSWAFLPTGRPRRSVAVCLLVARDCRTRLLDHVGPCLVGGGGWSSSTRGRIYRHARSPLAYVQQE